MATSRRQQPHNKALHPTAYSPLVPRFLSAAGELDRSAACARLSESQADRMPLNCYFMRSQRKKFLLLLIPVLLFGVIWGINWRRLHPPPTTLERKVRALLLSADRIDVEVETIVFPGGGVRTPVTRLAPEELAPILKNLNLTQEQASDWGTGYDPEMCFIFYKGGHNQAEITISYSPIGFNYFFSNKPQFPAWISRGLHSATIHRFRELVARHPEMIKALTAAGAEPQDLATNKLAKNKP